ncbi:hypothetical protein KQI86_15600 [Clostridium sp. MSJ-11]|uniref:HTH cro/C1-type domain-containing protein n=1 Tax=Clostridium mobile TaxID=2841512 RepID=A0ABS6EKK6_9CLOT|nr:hypothetical protein [Clostridium mobile]MBU5485745.1 hypothetical protein [Clostridium mobile]
MMNFTKNINDYVSFYKIKQTFIVNQTGIEKNKLSRLLNGKQDIVYEDMILISKALGKEVEYFMQDNLKLEASEYKDTSSIAFYMGEPDQSKIELANKVFDFLEHIDAILGVRKKIEKDSLEVLDYGI